MMEVPVSPWADLTQWSLLVGFLYPIVAAFLKQSTLSKTVNTLIAVVFAGVAAVITCAANGDVDFDTWAQSAITIYTVAVASYYGLWSNLGEQKLQDATTVVNRSQLAARRNTSNNTNYDGHPA